MKCPVPPKSLTPAMQGQGASDGSFTSVRKSTFTPLRLMARARYQASVPEPVLRDSKANSDSCATRPSSPRMVAALAGPQVDRVDCQATPPTHWFFNESKSNGIQTGLAKGRKAGKTIPARITARHQPGSNFEQAAPATAGANTRASLPVKLRHS